MKFKRAGNDRDWIAQVIFSIMEIEISQRFRSKADHAAQLNDRIRQEGLSAQWRLSPRVKQLSLKNLEAVIQKVQDYEEFGLETDSHESGAFRHEERNYFWMIDYYRPYTGAQDAIRAVPLDPSDPGTMRVLRLMLKEEL
jgi:hypothetical protein